MIDIQGDWSQGPLVSYKLSCKPAIQLEFWMLVCPWILNLKEQSDGLRIRRSSQRNNTCMWLEERLWYNRRPHSAPNRQECIYAKNTKHLTKRWDIFAFIFTIQSIHACEGRCGMRHVRVPSFLFGWVQSWFYIMYVVIQSLFDWEGNTGRCSQCNCAGSQNGRLSAPS